MQNRYQQLLSANLSSEQFSRQALGLLEAELRKMVLLSLHEWLKLNIISPDLFNAVANLRFPAWGSWNGLLIALHKVRNKALQQSNAETRERIEASPLSNLLSRLFGNIKNDATKIWLPAFYKQSSKASVPRKVSLQSLLSSPVWLRNRIAHDHPTDADFWQQTSEMLRPTIQWLAEQNLANDQQQLQQATPWFIEKNNHLYTFNGISSKGDRLNYVSDTGTSLEDDEYIGDILLILKKIMGKKDLQEADFQKLLSKLAPEESKGVLIGDYLVGDFIAEGAHGAVHKGIQLSTGRHIAIKFLKKDLPEDVGLRFKQEAEFLSRLNHPHIVDVIAYAENKVWHSPKARQYSLDDEKWYQDFSQGLKTGIKTFIVMEWISGQTLDDYYASTSSAQGASATKSGQFTSTSLAQNNDSVDFPKLTQWFIDLCTALEHVHQSNIIHRDIKPSNIMLNEQGIIKLMDFGIARSYEGFDARLTNDLNARLGSPAYMSPEQIKANQANDRVAPASDIYGLSAVFYELYTQHRLYNHDDENVTVDTITQLKTDKDKKERPTAPVKYNKKIPWEINTILSIGLEHEISDRYQDMESLRRDLVHVQRSEPIEYRRPTVNRRAKLWYRRNKKVANVVVMSLLVITGLTGWYLLNLEKSKQETEQQLVESSHNFGLIMTEKAEKALKNKKYNHSYMYFKHALVNLKNNNLTNDAVRLKINQTPTFPIALSILDDSSVIAVKYSPDGKELASISDNSNVIKIWNAVTGKLLKKLKGSTKSILTISYSPNGKKIASGSEHSITLWDLNKNKVEATFKDAALEPKLAFSPNSKLLAWTTGEAIKIWDTAMQELITDIGGGNATTIIFSPDGRSIVEGHGDSTVEIWNILTKKSIVLGKPVGRVGGESNDISSLSYHPNSKQLALASENGSIEIWDINNSKKLYVLNHMLYNSVNDISYSLNGKLLFSATNEGVEIWGTESRSLLLRLDSDSDMVTSISVNPIKNQIVSSSRDKSIKNWDITNISQLMYMSEIVENGSNAALRSLSRLAYNKDGGKIAVSTGGYDFKVVNAVTGEAIITLDYNDSIGHIIRFNTDNDNQVIIKNVDEKFLLWNIQTNKITNSNDEFKFSIDDSANKNKEWIKKIKKNRSPDEIFSSSDKKIVVFVFASTVSEEGVFSPNKVELWSTLTQELVTTFTLDTGYLNAFCFSPDSKQLAIAVEFGTIQIWDVATGNKIGELEGYATSSIMDIAYNPNGKEITSVSSEGSTHLWNIENTLRTPSLNKVDWKTELRLDEKRFSLRLDGITIDSIKLK